MAKMLRLLVCENCGEEIGEEKHYRAFNLDGKTVCEECYKEAKKSDRARSKTEKAEQ